MKTLLIVIICSLKIFANAVSQDEGSSNSPYILESDSLPKNLNFMPTLGNGQLGFTIFGDSIFVNGVYNGKGGFSHRARIPNIGNISYIPIGIEGYTKESYKLDLFQGVFERKQSNSEIQTITRTYPHRFFNRAIIIETFVQRISNASAKLGLVKLRLDTRPGEDSDDFSETSIEVDGKDNNFVSCRQTKDLENSEFQKSVCQVCMAVSKKDDIILLPNQTSTYMRTVIVLGETPAITTKELNRILNTSNDQLFLLHSVQWKTFWKKFHITLDGNLDLSRTINAGIFYLASSLPSPVSFQPCVSFFGLSPTGLGRGNLEDDYQGHNFWDTEIWMLPVVAQLSTDWARNLLNYRFRMIDAAVDNANRTGYSGARFPWESALTGTEVTNPGYPEVAQQQIHITADIAFAVRHYFAIANDTDWMKQEGCMLLKNIATFWVDRASLDLETGQYNINYVMGPDEDHENVTNNVYTNVAVHNALEFVHTTRDICGTNVSFAAQCLHIAENLKVPYDATLNYHPQFEGYTIGTRIKQADAVLLSYPMLYPMNISTLSNNLRIYGNVTRPTGPAMTWSMHAIGHLDEDNPEKAKELFERGYRDYVRQPFKVWSELIEGKNGAVNFITGVGGFMQAIINGYGGIRFHSNQMEIKKPNLLPGTKSAVISGIRYQGSQFSLKLASKPSIIADYLSDKTLYLVNEQGKSNLISEGVEYSIEMTSFVKAGMHS